MGSTRHLCQYVHCRTVEHISSSAALPANVKKSKCNRFEDVGVLWADGLHDEAIAMNIKPGIYISSCGRSLPAEDRKAIGVLNDFFRDICGVSLARGRALI